jgi:hypothetical protein
MGRLRQLRKELFRRKVVRVVLAYLAVFYGPLAALSQFQDVLNIPNWVLLLLIVIGIVGIPIVAFLAWKYDIVPPQLVRDVKDLRADNPGLAWARLRHDAREAGYVLLSWTGNEGGSSEKRYFQPVSIGRDPSNDIELGDERVSRHHAVIWAEDGIWHIRDLDSANGTFIGHGRVAGSAPMPHTCDLRFHVNGPIVSVHVAQAAETRVG